MTDLTQATLKAEAIAKLAPRSRQVFDVLSLTTEGMTMGEVFEYLKAAEPASMLGYNENLTSRANDLERAGLIVRCGRRTCGLSGGKATVWRQRVTTDDVTKPRAPRRAAEKKLAIIIDGLRDVMNDSRILERAEVTSRIATLLGEAQNP